MSKVNIERLSPKHEASWRELWNGYLHFYEHPLSEQVTADTFRRLVQRVEGLRGYIAIDASGKAIGLVHTLYHANTWSMEPKCYLEDLYVAPDARGTGCGRALIEHVRKQAAAFGCAMVYWHTTSDNATARRLYDRVGQLSDFVKYDLGLRG